MLYFKIFIKQKYVIRQTTTHRLQREISVHMCEGQEPHSLTY